MKLKTLKAKFAVENINLVQASGVPSARWEPFQINFLNTESKFTADVKSRQIAWSFTAALDAVVDGILVPNTPHIFVSINMEEAKEKIRYARDILEATNPIFRPEITRITHTEIELKNGSRFISHPSRPPRGKARTRVYLDEIAHYKDGLDREIYTAALPATVKGDGYIKLGSSPLGARGVFWEIITEAQKKYPGYVRQKVPWWKVLAFCKNVPKAVREAPAMSTAERVEKFGNEAIQQLFDNMFLEDFKQEFECDWVDESVAWITWETIKANQQPTLKHFHAHSVDEGLTLLNRVAASIESGIFSSDMAGGIDIGRKHDLTELCIMSHERTLDTKRSTYPIRFMVSLAQVKYDDQEAFFKQVMRILPRLKLNVDATGLGGQIAENLGAAYPGRVEECVFTNPSKEDWAVNARVLAERESTPLPVDRGLAYQIHSIKKKITAAKNIVFDTEKNEKHHADKFWAWALGLWRYKTSGPRAKANVSQRSIMDG